MRTVDRANEIPNILQSLRLFLEKEILGVLINDGESASRNSVKTLKKGLKK